MPQILFGTCGWSYAEWEGILYPHKQSKLKQYSSIFPTVEIDSTFYSLPRDGIVLGWVRYTPPSFVFSAKLSQTITHKKALDTARGIEPDLDQFLETMGPAIEAGKLTCVLVQLPPFLRFNAQRLEAFLNLLPDRPSFAVEFRHQSWLRDETFKLLERYKTAYTIVDEPALPPEIHVTSNLAYVRWHGRGNRPWFNYRYSKEQLQEWVPKIKEVTEKTERILGYFNNHFHGYAPENCLQIMQMLDIQTPRGSEALNKITSHKEDREPAKTSLEAWTGPVAERTVEKLLLKFTEADIIKNARAIPDKDLSLRQDNKRGLAAYIGQTNVTIDLEEHTIIHRCPFFFKSSSQKRFCPHIAKLFLAISPERARTVLSLIKSNVESWKFESKFSVEFPK